MKITEIKKTVPLTLVGIDGNAFMIMTHFFSYAKKSGWTTEEIDCVIKEATSGDYNYLIKIISQFCV